MTLQAIRSIKFLAELPAELQSQIAEFCLIRHVRAGETIFCQGEPSPYCFGIVSGQITIYRVPSGPGSAPIALSVLGPGSIFGEQALFLKAPRTAMAQATQAGELLAIKGSDLRKWLDKTPQAMPLLFKLLETSLSRLYQANRQKA